MQKSVLSEVILSLSDKEIRELNKWLNSPAHNHREDAVDLFDFLIKSKNLPEKEVIWKAIFPKEPFDDAFLRQVMYFLLKAIEDYLVFKEYKKEPVRPVLSLASIYRRRHLDKPYRQALETAKRKLTETPFRNSEYHFDKFNVEQEQYFYSAAAKSVGDMNLQLVSNELDMAFVANKLRIACRMLSHQAIDKKATYDIGLLEPMLKMVEEKSMLDEVGVAVYYYGYRAITDRNEPAHFENLTRILNEHSASFPKPELRELYLLSINYCVSRINIGQEIFFSKAFDLYRKGFDLEVLVDEQDIVSKFIFTNTVYSAIKTKNYEWAESFIEKFSSRLEDKHRHSTVQFNLSRLYYERNDYDKAQILLREFEYDDMLMNVVAKIMLLKIYYKTGEYDALESLIEAVRSYLQRKEVMSQSYKNVFKNIIMLMKKLLHLNTYSKPQVEKFRKAVMETNPIQEQEREWFLQQINGK
ncbi:MAG: hypothetical protein RIR11_1310 [Bacteroidota bacterium]|jgi:hypothetical protein